MVGSLKCLHFEIGYLDRIDPLIVTFLIKRPLIDFLYFRILRTYFYMKRDKTKKTENFDILGIFGCFFADL